MTSDTGNKYFLGFFLALAAGLIWSFGAPTIRYMVDAQIYQWHYLFCRGITVATVLVIFLLYKEGLAFRHNFKKVGLSGLLGGVGLAFAFIFFIPCCRLNLELWCAYHQIYGRCTNIPMALPILQRNNGSNSSSNFFIIQRRTSISP